ncbi:hypothetical protein IX317_000599 [Fusobacterium sp. DD29]|uniref:phage antirepressor KilAC domain-containing protein n=1 Tax=unclassified Fusobacterium TaxID=2648384 RepID=UPI001B8C67BE|nr:MULTISPECIES: phage antirepressor KilAC domain-containing protein [unclassified Fusobacterium]MBR8700279.1 hypothetical protein [Fusobacterium sp. DD45]MBR8710466.1 hypothetical protein [Fusobacterium sp. DD28]MBR8748938.1 hypothetical protein [Fusobacterium sp. DD29]MBR8751084.1 hypothetical protein [Fusobacterium sp. DD26]MBR8761244.1 hypothetical protein [Fusobacterium sp. DD25]
MNQLIKIEEKNGEQLVSGRELHAFLEVGTQYSKWFERMREYGFSENIDYIAISQKRLTAQGNETTYIEHFLKIAMAKEISMIQRNEKGKQAREYFIKCEEAWNSPEMILVRATQISNRMLDSYKNEIETLKLDNKIKDQQIQELKPKATYYDLILQCKDLLSVTEIAKDYGMSAMTFNKKLHELGVQFKQSGVWFLYQKYASYGYTQTKTQNYNRPDGTQGVATHMYWTQKGRLFLYEFLKGQGIVPMIER